MKRRLLTLALASLLATPVLASGPASSSKHIILFIGDGMQLHHEIAASRYFYGADSGLSFHGLPEAWNVSTWDVTTYDNYARLLGEDPYDLKRIKPAVGYDPARGRGGARAAVRGHRGQRDLLPPSALRDRLGLRRDGLDDRLQDRRRQYRLAAG